MALLGLIFRKSVSHGKLGHRLAAKPTGPGSAHDRLTPRCSIAPISRLAVGTVKQQVLEEPYESGEALIVPIPSWIEHRDRNSDHPF